MHIAITIGVSIAIAAGLLAVSVRNLSRDHHLVRAIPLIGGLVAAIALGHWLAIEGTAPYAVTWAAPAVVWGFGTMLAAVASSFDRHWLPMLVAFGGFAGWVVGVMQAGFL